MLAFVEDEALSRGFWSQLRANAYTYLQKHSHLAPVGSFDES